MARALERNVALERLALMRNQIGNEGVTALARALRFNCKLQRLGLMYNTQFGLPAVAELALTLSTANVSLTFLGLDHCTGVGLAGLHCLHACVASNATLLSIDLDDVGVPRQVALPLATAIGDELRANTCPEVVALKRSAPDYQHGLRAAQQRRNWRRRREWVAVWHFSASPLSPSPGPNSVACTGATVSEPQTLPTIPSFLLDDNQDVSPPAPSAAVVSPHNGGDPFVLCCVVDLLDAAPRDLCQYIIGSYL